ncbi:hypothetical protein PVAP13_9NG209473 [Panicum virgatum]|uniref:Secreted protein n=1 Tax=Panicum virgatum TaxID=38727 RepID=A0A8T0MH44_PANVG|nr:hypothetical protein PVAP13_9NG209473 [Panicum virgatum]
MAAVLRLLMFPSATSSPLVLRCGSKQAVAHLRRRGHGRPRWRPRQPVQQLTAVRPWPGAERNHKSAWENHGNVWMSDQCPPQRHAAMCGERAWKPIRCPRWSGPAARTSSL